MEILIFTCLIIFLLVGFLGIFIPALPGIPFMLLLTIVYAIADHWQHISVHNIAILAVLTGVSLAIDYLSGVLGAKFFGASAKGTLGGLIGSILGLVLFPPLGIFIGLALGVLIGELVYGKNTVVKSTKASVGAILGALAGIVLNLAIGIIYLTYFIISFWK